MQYLSRDEAEQFIGGIRQVLSGHGGAWYSSDWNVDYEQFSTRNMSSPEGVKYYNETRRQIMKSSNVFNEGVSFLSEDEKQSFLESQGLKVEKLPFYYGDENLAMLRAVAPDKMDAIMDQLKKSSFWKMTLDESYAVREKITGAKEIDDLHVDCSAAGSRLICRIAGRIDTISAPALLEVLEKNGDGFEELSVEAERLEYLSSAGIRVLLMASKKFGKMSIRHASDAVKKIFADSGFDQQISVE
jgi:anti-sigma B factor antagonist